jgi:hypothetical protein
MAYEVKDHGTWTAYVPDPMPDWAKELPLGATPIFIKRDGDGVDFYEYRKRPGVFKEGALVATTLRDTRTGDEIVMAIFRDHGMPFPNNQRLIEIDGVDPDDPKPWKLFEQTIYDPETKTFLGEPGLKPPEVVLSVSSAQAMIQLSRMPHDGSVVPGTDNLADAVEGLIAASTDRELKYWFARAQRWLINNPNVAKIGGAFNLSDAEILEAFQAAQKIEE